MNPFSRIYLVLLPFMGLCLNLNAQLNPEQEHLNTRLNEAFNNCEPSDVFRQFPNSPATMPLPGMGLNGKITYGQGVGPDSFNYSSPLFKQAIG